VGSTGGIGIPSAEQFRWRLEPVLIASLVGAALACSGVVYQAILRNPLADPYLLGISSGAALFAYLWHFGAATAMLTALGSGGAALSQQAFAFAGAITAVMIVFFLASSRGRLEPITLLLVGVIVNAVNGSIFLLLNAITRERPAGGGPLSFLVGGINTTLTAEQKWVALMLIAAGWLAMMYLSGQLNVAALGEAEAEALGVRIHRLRWLGLVIASLVTASAVAISGPIGFVGLVCPHLARLIVGRDARWLLPVATAGGAALLVLADAASRYLAGAGRAETMLPVGVLTGLLGGPFFLLLLWRNRRRPALETQP
jgi:iron complex transport system permease protein